jgi:hypothetical protein
MITSSQSSRRQFITNRTARTQDNKNVGRKPVTGTHWHGREREKKRERERNLKGRKRREGGHGLAGQEGRRPGRDDTILVEGCQHPSYRYSHQLATLESLKKLKWAS